MFAQAMRARGFVVYTFDVQQGPRGDLLRKPVRDRIRRLLRSGMCMGVVAGVPCTSFSRARGGGIRAIRSYEKPGGVAGLTPDDKAKVELGNRLLQISVDLFLLCWHCDIAFVWENPRTSWMWEHPLAKRIAALAGVSDVHLNMCAFGAAWFKPTRMRVFGLRRPEFLSRLCHRKKHEHGWICQHSGRPHTILQGRDSQNVNWTARAAAYPVELGRALAEVMSEACFERELRFNLRHAAAHMRTA